MSQLGIGAAITDLLAGKRVRREGWDASIEYLVLIIQKDSNMALKKCMAEGASLNSWSYIGVKTIHSPEIQPWNYSQLDMLSNDWAVYTPPTP